MSSGFLLADALAELLRKPYHRGDMATTVGYAVAGLKIGKFRVMLKRDFDTACWIPPVGKRGSHSIYYGDRMVARVLERFVKIQEIEMPPAKDLVAQIKKDLADEKAAYKLAKELRDKTPAVKGKRPAPLPKVNPMSVPTRLLDVQLKWLRDNTDEDVWSLFGDWLHKAIMSYGRHERSHARHSPVDLKQVNRDLKTLDIPFMYWNLFEDARIEHLDRQDQDEPFDWMMFEDLAPANNPHNMFLRCIQFEGAPDSLALENDDAWPSDPGRTVGNVAESVEAYYKRACKCSTSEQLYPIMVEFLTEFKEDLKPPEGEEGEGEGGGEGGSGGGGGSSSGTPSGKGKGKPKPGSKGAEDEDEEDEDTGARERAGDLSTAAEAAEMGDDFFKDFEKDAEIVGGTDDEGAAAEEAAKDEIKGKTKAPPPKGKGGNGAGIPESIEPQESGGRASTSDFLAHAPGAMDDVFRSRVDNLTGMLMRMFKTHSLPAALEAPGQRMSGRHLAHGELRWIHKRVFGGKGKRKYTIVYDCSGSMGGKPDREGKLLLLALNNLAKRGYLEGHLILSGWVGHRPGWLSYKFPVSEEVILRIDPDHSSEGLQSSLADNLKHIKGMDDVYVMTDANICDAPIDRAYFAKNRVWPVGLYVGSKANSPRMEKHFPQNIIRDSIEEVVETMLTRNRRTVG